MSTDDRGAHSPNGPYDPNGEYGPYDPSGPYDANGAYDPARTAAPGLPSGGTPAYDPAAYAAGPSAPTGYPQAPYGPQGSVGAQAPQPFPEGQQQGYGYGPSGYGNGPQTPRDTGNDRTIAILSHLSLFIGALTIGYLGWLVPLILWLVYKDRSPLIRGASAGSFNFAITMLIVSTVAGILQPTVILAPIGWVLWVGVFVLSILFPILAAIAANRGEIYRYPLTLPILR
jgi:uncharacterized protein